MARTRAARITSTPRLPPAVPRYALWVAAGVAIWTFAEWSISTQIALDEGMYGGDTLWYHMPTAARFAQEGSTLGLHFTDALSLSVWFYPHTYELIDGAAIALFDSDVLAPVMNLGWLGVALLAAWCVGRPFGLGPQTLVGAALVLNTNVMWETQPGEARNDIMVLALLLAFVAFLLSGRAPGPSLDPARSARPAFATGTLVLAGVAGGLAVSAKLTMLVPVFVIALGVILVSAQKARRRTALVLACALAVAGSYWYARNLAMAGNPLPLVGGVGPFDLPNPEQMTLYPRPPHSVAGYVFDPEVVRYWFLPQLKLALGPLFALILLAGLASVTHTLMRERDRLLRVLAIAALLTAAFYVFNPIGASGPEGEPKGFYSNTRYLMAALLLALTVMPLSRSLRVPERRRRLVLWTLTGAFAITAVTTLPPQLEHVGGALFLTLLLVCAPLALMWLRSSKAAPRAALVGGALALSLLALVLGRGQQLEYAEGRYADPEPFFREAGPVEAFSWARDLEDKRIGVVGAGQVFFTQYAWYGSDLSNYVQYLGMPGPNGAYTLPRTCKQLRNRVNAGNFDYIVTTRYGTDTRTQTAFPMRAWLNADDALDPLLTERVYPQPASVFEVRGELDPLGCEEPRILARRP